MATIHALALAGVLAVAAPTATSCVPPAAGTGSSPTTGSSDVDYSASCDGDGRAFDVDPDTPAARAEAQRRCTRVHDMVNNAPWPNGYKPVPLPGGN